LSYSLNKGVRPHQIRASKSQLAQFQDWIRQQGLETHWPSSK
jgi:hypothetical protein